MTQQRKIRPTRAERARQKTRIPNLPQGRLPVERHFEPAAPASPVSAPAPTFNAAPAPTRLTARAAAEPQDYSYVRSDLIRITVVTGLLTALMAVLSFVVR